MLQMQCLLFVLILPAGECNIFVIVFTYGISNINNRVDGSIFP